MSETVDSLILDLLEWIGLGRRAYAETMEAWPAPMSEKGSDGG